MLDQHALWDARRARGVNDIGKMVGPEPDRGAIRIGVGLRGPQGRVCLQIDHWDGLGIVRQ